MMARSCACQLQFCRVWGTTPKVGIVIAGITISGKCYERSNLTVSKKLG